MKGFDKEEFKTSLAKFITMNSFSIYPVRNVTFDKKENVRQDNKIPFSSEMLREIFNANKTSDECHLSFVDDGLLRLIFRSEGENIDSTYFVVRKADY